MLKKLLPIALSAALCLPAFADEASVKKALETKLGAKVTSVTKSPYLGLYEVTPRAKFSTPTRNNRSSSPAAH